MKYVSRTLLAIAATTVLAGPLWAADEPAPAAIAAPASAPAPSAAAASAVIETDQDLAALSGGANTTIALTDQDLTAVNSGNQINAANVGSGAISLQGGALSGFNGIGNFIMNTGHNNNLQSSMSVTIIVNQ
jgi:hypothetical protein